MSEYDLHQFLIFVWFLLSGIVFAYLLRRVAPYGRYARQDWGPTISNRLGWVLMEAPAALTIFVFYLTGDQAQTPALVALVLWELHYLYRAFLYPLRLKTSGKRIPAVIVASGVFFNVVNGYLNGRWLFHFAPSYPSGFLSSPLFIAGIALFFCGWVMNLHADEILFSLRQPGDTSYRIPQGGMYRFISAPNYFGELVEWFGWALLSASLSGLSFFVWTAANLIPRALSHHRWYQQTFPEYPSERRAVIPFLL
jgi:protein-S-isoprenylcysteine O-methyltransferase Ste14